MANQDDSGKSWLEKLVFPLILVVVAAAAAAFFATDAPWWVQRSTNPAPTPEPNQTPEPTTSPEPPPAPVSQEIRKQGYIFRMEDCRTTGEAGAVVCDFTVEAESERKNLQIRALDTFLMDPEGRFHFASRIDFGSGGSPTSASSDLIPGNPIEGTASFQNIPPGFSYFREFKLDGYIYGEGKLTANFSDVSLAN